MHDSLGVASIERVHGLLEGLRLMPLGVSHSEAYGIVERWQDDGGTIQYGRDLAEWIGPEGDETAANFTELIVLALNMLPTLLRAYEESARYREALRLLIPTGDGGFVVIEHAEYESVKAVVDEVQGVR